jgi:hypothetical protein
MEIKKKLHILFAFVLIAVTACQKDKLVSKGTDLPVIESYLIQGQPIVVKLYQQKNLNDTALYGQPISGIKVYILTGDEKLQLGESAKGVYNYTDKDILVTGKTYTLQFDYNGHSVAASTVMPPKPANFASQYGGITLPTIGGSGGANNNVLNIFTWSNPNALHHVLAFKATSGIIPVSMFGRTLPVNSQINTNRALQYNITGREFAYQGNYMAILFSANQEYINLLDNNANSTSSQTLTQIPTNIVNGFGIFTAMQADTLNFNVY